MEKMIIDLEKKSWDVFIKKQMEEAKKLSTSDSRSIDSGGVKNLDEGLKDMNNYEMKNFSMSDIKVTFPVKDTAIITYKFTADAKYKGKDTSGTYVSASVWVNQGGEWKAAFYAETKAEPQPKK